MADISRTNGYKPARGLQRLTWRQVEEIDAKISSLCAFTECGQDEARLVLVVKRGKLRFVESIMSQELEPAR